MITLLRQHQYIPVAYHTKHKWLYDFCQAVKGLTFFPVLVCTDSMALQSEIAILLQIENYLRLT